MTATRERLAPTLALAGLCLGAFVYWWHHAQTALTAHQVQWGQDLAFFHQIFYAAVHGEAWTSPLLLEPQGFFEMVHFHPIFGALVPLYALRPSVDTLLAFNIAAVVGAAIPLALLAQACTSRRWFGVAAAAAWLLWPPVEAAALADFRPLHFMLPGWMAVALGVHTRRRLPLLFGALLCMLAREEAAYLLATSGAVLTILPYGKARRRKEGLWLLGLGALWFGVLLAIKGNLFFHFDPLAWFAAGEGGPSSDLTITRLGHLASLLFGGFIAAVYAPTLLAVAAPVVLWLLLDPYREWHALNGNYVHYRAVLLPWIAAGGVIGLAHALERWTPRFGERIWAFGTLLLISASTLAMPRAHAQFHAEVLDQNRAAAHAPERAERQALIDQLTTEDALVTDYGLIASVSGRPVVWASAQLYSEEPAPWHWKTEWPLNWSAVDTALLRSDDPLFERLPADWTKISEGGAYSLWRKQGSSAPSATPVTAATCPPGMVHISGGTYTTGMRAPLPYGVVETANLDRVEAPEAGCSDAIAATPGATACWVQTDLHDPIVTPHKVTVEDYCIASHPFPGEGGRYPADGLTTWDAQLFDELLQSGQYGERRLCTFTEYELAVAGPQANRRFVFGNDYDSALCPSGDDTPIGANPACHNPETGVYEYGAVHSQWVLLDEPLVSWACETDETCAASGGRRLDERTDSGELAIRYIVAGGTNRGQTRQAPHTPHTFHDHGDPTGPDGCDSWGWDDQVAVCATPSTQREACASNPTAAGCEDLSANDNAWASLRAYCAARTMSDCLNRGLRPLRGDDFDACPDRAGFEGPGQGQ